MVFYFPVVNLKQEVLSAIQDDARYIQGWHKAISGPDNWYRSDRNNIVVPPRKDEIMSVIAKPD